MPDRLQTLRLSFRSALSEHRPQFTPPEACAIHLPDLGPIEPDPAKCCGVRSEVRVFGGVPTLFINGAPYPAAAYMTYLEPYNHYADFAAAGYTLFSIPVLFASRWISTASDMTPFAKGIFDKEDQPDFSVFDASVQKVLDVCPDAMILPRVNVSMPQWWISAHPELLDGTGTRESFYSDRWLSDAANMLRSFIRYVRGSRFGAHIAGYQIAGGNTEEWFHFDLNGGISDCAAAGYKAFLQKHCPNEPFDGLPDVSQLRQKGVCHRSANLSRFLEYVNTRVAACIAFLAHTAKEETGGSVAVGTFYGYALEVHSPLHGTHALNLLLESPDVDFICSPNSYLGLRDADLDWSEMYAADSVRLHGKLCMQECDVRTFLTRPLPDRAPEYDPKKHLTAPIWHGLPDQETTVAQTRKSFCRQLVKGNGFWWFDMWGGWYDDPVLMREMAAYRRIYADSLQLDRRKITAEIALFVDESVYWHMTECGLRGAAAEIRRPLGALGAPFDIYDVRDMDTVCTRYRAVLFSSCVKTTALRHAVERCRAEHVPYLLPSVKKPILTTRQLRAFCRKNGVHLYCESDDIVYVNDRYLAVHAVTAGKKTIRLPKPEQLTPLLGDPAVSMHGNTAVLTMKKGETVLLERT